MAIYITQGGFFGGFAVRPKRIKAYGPDGSPIYTDPVRISIKRTGINKDTKVSEGMFDTDHLPHATVIQCKQAYGEEGWKKKLEEEIDALRMPLIKLKPNEKSNVVPDKKVQSISGTRTVTAVKRPGMVRSGDVEAS